MALFAEVDLFVFLRRLLANIFIKIMRRRGIIIEGEREKTRKRKLGLLSSFVQDWDRFKDWTQSQGSVPSPIPCESHLLHTSCIQPSPASDTTLYAQAFYKACFCHAKNFLLSMKVVLLVSTLDIPFSKFLLWNEELLWTLQKKKST